MLAVIQKTNDKMKKLLLGLFATTILLTACKNDKENSTDIFTKVYSADNVATQAFTINADQDTVIKGISGTILRIYKNTFTDSIGQIVSGQINIELKEVLDISDIILCNLTTTSDGQYLQSGGMIYTNATSNGKQIQIADNKEIEVVIPTDSAKNGMQLFEGIQDNIGINWKNPVALGNNVVAVPLEEIDNNLKKRTNVGFYIKGFEDWKDYPAEVNSKISAIVWEGDGLVLSKDSIIQIGIYTVYLIKRDSIEEFNQLNVSFNQTAPIKGSNTFTEDPKTNYIFSLKKLGWANIDRFFSDPRTKEVELITSIENHSDFKTIYVSMIVSNQKMYLPGYQKTDNTFSFTHGDFEKTSLPVGETATILATAYKDEKPYFAIKRIIIKDKQTVSFKLDETTMDKLKADLKEKI